METKTDRSLQIVNACMILTLGVLCFGVCLLLYANHLEFQKTLQTKTEGLEYQVEMLREKVDRLEMQWSEKNEGVTPF